MIILPGTQKWVLIDGVWIDTMGERLREQFDSTTDIEKLSVGQLRRYVRQLREEKDLLHWDYQDRM